MFLLPLSILWDTLDIVGMVMSFQGKKYPLIKIGKIGCYRVVGSEQSRSEVILECKLVEWNSNNTSIGVIESSEGCLSSNRGVIARTFVKAGDKVPIRYANFSSDSQILYPGTNIAESSPVQVIRTVQKVKSRPPRNLPKDLPELYERASEGMSSMQKKQTASLLGKLETYSPKTITIWAELLLSNIKFQLIMQSQSNNQCAGFRCICKTR